MKNLGQEEVELHQRLSALSWQASEDIKALSRLGAPETRGQAQDIRDRVVQALKDYRDCLRRLEGLGEEQETPEGTAELGELSRDHRRQYDWLKSSLDNSYAQMKKNAEEAKSIARRELLKGGKTSGHKVQSEQQAMKASRGVTDNLRRTREQIAQQIELTDGNLDVLGTSATTLTNAKDELQSQTHKFTSTRKLLTTVEKHDIWDRIVLWGGVLFFSIVVGYVFQERMLGITPDFVKSAITNAASSSIAALYTLGEGLLRGNASVKDSILPSKRPGGSVELDRHESPDTYGLHTDDAGPPGPDTCESAEYSGTCSWDIVDETTKPPSGSESDHHVQETSMVLEDQGPKDADADSFQEHESSRDTGERGNVQRPMDKPTTEDALDEDSSVAARRETGGLETEPLTDNQDETACTENEEVINSSEDTIANVHVEQTPIDGDDSLDADGCLLPESGDGEFRDETSEDNEATLSSADECMMENCDDAPSPDDTAEESDPDEEYVPEDDDEYL